MPEVSRVARFIFHVTLRQVPDFSFLSDIMPAPCCLSSFRYHALAKKSCFPYIIIARLGKAEYLESLRQISSLVIARLGKAEAIQYKLLNHYINAFIRKDYQTGLLRSARNDAGGGETGFSGQAQK